MFKPSQLLVFFCANLMILKISASSLQQRDPICNLTGSPVYYEPNGYQCCLCPPGAYLYEDCKENFPATTVCKECLFNDTVQTYMPQNNNRSLCFESLPSCDETENTELQLGSIIKNNECVCKKGFFSKNPELRCEQHKKCPPGFGVSILGNFTHDTVCKACGNGTFSSNSSSTELCMPFKECSENETVTFTGSPVKDVECTSQDSLIHSNVSIALGIAGLVCVLLVFGFIVVGRKINKYTSPKELIYDRPIMIARPKYNQLHEIEMDMPFSYSPPECPSVIEMDQNVIGERGGVVEFEGCTVDFPEGALVENTPIKIEFCQDMSLPPELIPITHIMKFSPTTTLCKKANVEITSWCTATAEGEHAYLYFKEKENDEWKEIKTVKLKQENTLDFDTFKFCFFSWCIKSAKNKKFHFEIRMYYNTIGRLTHRIMPRNNTSRNKVKSDLGDDFKTACSGRHKIKLMVDDEVKITLQNIKNKKGESFGPLNDSQIIDKGYLRDVEHNTFGKDIFMDTTCVGIIDFDHQIQCLPSSEAREEDIFLHQDRIDIRADQQMIVANNVNQGGEMQVTQNSCHNDPHIR